MVGLLCRLPTSPLLQRSMAPQLGVCHPCLSPGVICRLSRMELSRRGPGFCTQSWDFELSEGGGTAPKFP